MKNLVLVLLLIFAAFVIPDCNSWRRGRRRRRWYSQDCVLYYWTDFGSGFKTCGWGYKSWLKHVRFNASYGGTPCPTASSPQRNWTSPCYVRCCPVNCLWSWNSQSPCQGCGTSQQTRTMSITQFGEWGGSLCPTGWHETRSCKLECKLQIVFLLHPLLRRFIEQFRPFVLLLSHPRASMFPPSRFICAFFAFTWPCRTETTE